VDTSAYPSRRQEELHWKLFSPRLGIAYRFDPKTVVRSGYGISFLPADMDQAGPQLSQVVRAATSNINTFGQPLQASVANPLPNGINKPLAAHRLFLTVSSARACGRASPTSLWIRSNGTLRWSASSIPTRLSRLPTPARREPICSSQRPTPVSGFQLNQLPDNYDSLGAALQTQVANPFYGVLPASNFLGSPTIAEGYLLLPHPQYPLGLLQQAPRYGSSTYHALQVGYIQRFGHAARFQGAYTWGKVLSDTDNTSEFQDGQGDTGERQDEYNPRAEKSVSLQDIANNLVVNYGVDLPIGHGQP